MKTKENILMLAFTLFIYSHVFAQSNKGDKSEQNKTNTRKMYVAFETGDSAVLPRYVASNYTEHSPDSAIKAPGLEGLKESVVRHYTTATKMKMTILNMAADRDVVMVHVNISDTDASPDKDPKDLTGGINGVDVFRFENGKAVEHWGYFK